MKFAFVFGKGIDGCGVTRGALIFEKWLREAGHDTMVLAFENGQSFGRARDINFIGPVSFVSTTDVDVSPDIVRTIDSCDVVILHSHPTSKQYEYVERYRRFVEKIENPIKVLHDHAIIRSNMSMVPQYCELASLADVCVTQSHDGFGQLAMKTFDPGLNGRVLENPIWLDTRSLDRYRRPWAERDKRLIYMGRMSSLKDPAFICRIEPHLPEPWTLMLCGCESSIASVSDLTPDPEMNPAPYTPRFRKKIHQYAKNKTGYKLAKAGAPADFPARITSYDNYEYSFGMDLLGSSLATWCGYRLLDEHEYGHRMEYTVVESLLLSLPILNRQFVSTARSPEGRLWNEYDGFLLSQCKEEREAAEELQRVCLNQREWEERTQACRELAHRFNDVEVLAPKFLDQVLALGKREDKPDPMDTVEGYFPDVREVRAGGRIVVTSPTSVMKRRPTVLDGRKQVEYKVKRPKPDPSSSLEEFF